MSKKVLRFLSIWLIQGVMFTFMYGVKANIPGEMANSNPIYVKLRNIGISNKGVRVENLIIKKDVATITLKQGTVHFLDDVNGQNTGAIFIGEGEFQMTPLLKVEQNYLKVLTGSSSIQEHFSSMTMRFTDSTAKSILSSGKPEESSTASKARSLLKNNRKILRKGKKYIRPMQTIALTRNNIDLRLLIDIINPRSDERGFFYSRFKGKKYGDMLFILDPLAIFPYTNEEVVLACLNPNRLGTWVSEHSIDYFKKHHRVEGVYQLVNLEHYDIDARIHDNFLEARTSVRFSVLEDGIRVVPFNIFPSLRVKRVTDEMGQELAFIQESKKKDSDFAVILPENLKKGDRRVLTFEYGGKDAVTNSGGGNFTLSAGARFSWYPTTFFGDRATVKMTLRTPKGLEVVGTGQPLSRTIKGDTVVSRWKSDIALIAIGFNYGQFDKATVKDKETKLIVESYANRKMPDLFEQYRNTLHPSHLSFNPASIDPTKMMEKVRSEAHVGINLYTKMFGPMVYDRVYITQQIYPNFGQAWPMLVYMPIISYFSDTQLQQLGMANSSRFLASVCAHEVGHQWWGHTVGMKSYRSNWIIEGMAQLSASLFLQKVFKNKKFIDFWKSLRRRSLQKNRKRVCPAKVGSVTLGYRLDNAKTGFTGGSVIYGKSAFIFHMLRMMMWTPETGDKQFSDMLKDITSTYFNQNMSTEELKLMIEKHMTPEMNLDGNKKMDWFFNQWVHGTLIPHYSLNYDLTPAANGKVTLTCTVKQEKVDEQFKMLVPIYLDYGDKIIRLGNVKLQGNSTSPQIKVQLPKKPDKVTLCAFEDILCTYGSR